MTFEIFENNVRNLCSNLYTDRMIAIVAPIIMTIIVLVGTIGNILVLIVVALKQQMRNTTNILIAVSFFCQTSCLTMLIVRPNIINLSTVLMMIVTRKHICDALSFFVFVFWRSYIQPKYYDKKMKNLSYLMNGSQLDIRQLLDIYLSKNVHTYFNLSHNNSFFFNFLDVS